MNILRACAYIPLAALEIATLAACWGLAFVHKQAARRLFDWASKTFPSKEWYFTK